MKIRSIFSVISCFAVGMCLTGCQEKFDATSFDLDGDWVIDSEASNQGRQFKMPAPPGEPVYLSCKMDKCTYFSGILFKVTKVRDEIRLNGIDSNGVEVHFPKENFEKHPEVEFRFKVIGENRIQKLFTSGRAGNVLNRSNKK
jgi:hypothetical protein